MDGKLIALIVIVSSYAVYCSIALEERSNMMTFMNRLLQPLCSAFIFSDIQRAWIKPTIFILPQILLAPNLRFQCVESSSTSAVGGGGNYPSLRRKAGFAESENVKKCNGEENKSGRMN